MKLFRLTDPLFGLERRLGRRRTEARGVLVISAGGLGDTVLMSLLIDRFAALARPGERVTVLLRAESTRMRFLFPPEIEVIGVDFAALRRPAERRRILADLHRRSFRLVVSADYLRHPDLDEALARACAAPDSAAMEPRPWPKHDRRLAAGRRHWRRLIESGPVVQDKVVRLAAFAAALTGQSVPPPRVTLPPDRQPPCRDWDRPTVVVQPFSAVRAKQFPPDLYRRIRERLPAGWEMRIAGHPTDLDRNPEFRPLLDLPGVAFEPAPFADLAGRLRAARLVISVDTACMHLAVAVGAPTLCLASAAYVGEIVPYAPAVTPANVRFLLATIDCRGCLGDCRRPPVGSMYPCVAALDPETVLRAVAEMTEATP